MFGKNFQRKYALTDQGVKNVKKGAFWTVIVNLVVMGGMRDVYKRQVDARGARASLKAICDLLGGLTLNTEQVRRWMVSRGGCACLLYTSNSGVKRSSLMPSMR